jgi:hypothetical protein
MRSVRTALAAGCIAFLASAAPAAFTDTVVVSALWIGNSYTAKYVLPNSLRTMFRGARDGTYILMNNTEKIEWGEDLKYHYESTDALQTLTNGDFDYVILQDFPGSTDAAQQQKLEQYGSLFVNAAIQSGAVPVIFWTWPAEYNRSQLNGYVQMYEDFCDGRDVMIAPVNAAWRHVFGQRPDYPLYNDDELHQSPYGHYLNLCVFYSVFRRSSPEGITYRNWGEYPSAPLTQIAADTAAYLQAQAWAVVDSMLGPFTTAAGRQAGRHRAAVPGAPQLRPLLVAGPNSVPAHLGPFALFRPDGAVLRRIRAGQCPAAGYYLPGPGAD